MVNRNSKPKTKSQTGTKVTNNGGDSDTAGNDDVGVSKPGGPPMVVPQTAQTSKKQLKKQLTALKRKHEETQAQLQMLLTGVKTGVADSDLKRNLADEFSSLDGDCDTDPSDEPTTGPVAFGAELAASIAKGIRKVKPPAMKKREDLLGYLLRMDRYFEDEDMSSDAERLRVLKVGLKHRVAVRSRVDKILRDRPTRTYDGLRKDLLLTANVSEDPDMYQRKIKALRGVAGLSIRDKADKFEIYYERWVEANRIGSPDFEPGHTTKWLMFLSVLPTRCQEFCRLSRMDRSYANALANACRWEMVHNGKKRRRSGASRGSSKRSRHHIDLTESSDDSSNDSSSSSSSDEDDDTRRVRRAKHESRSDRKGSASKKDTDYLLTVSTTLAKACERVSAALERGSESNLVDPAMVAYNRQYDAHRQQQQQQAHPQRRYQRDENVSDVGRPLNGGRARRCWWCGKEGHGIRNCPLQAPDPKAAIRCNTCQELGHITRYCRNRKRDDEQDPPISGANRAALGQRRRGAPAAAALTPIDEGNEGKKDEQ